ncbi:MAG: type II-A CRISPR-associated protein Csn2 [Eggerthellaceae bacterium]
MKLIFSGFENPIEVNASLVSVLEIHNRPLFARVCSSLSSLMGERAVEPYSVWDEDKELLPDRALMWVGDPFNLPWKDRRLVSALYDKMALVLLEDSELRSRVEGLNANIASELSRMGLCLSGNYHFEVEWQLQTYLKSFGFGADNSSDLPLLDSLISFLSFLNDVSFKKALVFMGLKELFGEDDLEILYEQAIFLGIPLLLLENAKDCVVRSNESKRTVDLDFLEY